MRSGCVQVCLLVVTELKSESRSGWVGKLHSIRHGGSVGDYEVDLVDGMWFMAYIGWGEMCSKSAVHPWCTRVRSGAFREHYGTSIIFRRFSLCALTRRGCARVFLLVITELESEIRSGSVGGLISLRYGGSVGDYEVDLVDGMWSLVSIDWGEGLPKSEAHPWCTRVYSSAVMEHYGISIIFRRISLCARTRCG